MSTLWPRTALASTTLILAALTVGLLVAPAAHAEGGAGHVCVTKSDHTVWCWGSNTAQDVLGTGSQWPSASAVQYPGITDAVSVSGNGAFSCVLHTDHTVSCWGYNTYGQLGDGTTTGSSTPVAVSGLTDATVLQSSHDDACAVRAGGTIVCWGSNYYGQLGDGTTTDATAAGALERS